MKICVENELEGLIAAIIFPFSFGPLKWMAPEQLNAGRSVYSTQTDVYAYSVLLYEIMSTENQRTREKLN